MTNDKIQLMDTIRHAIIEGNISLAKDILIKNKWIIKSNTRSGGTLLHDAVGYNQEELVVMLLEWGIDTLVESPASGNYGTALNCAGTPEMANILINYGMKPELTVDDLKNPLFFQLFRENFAMVKFWYNFEMAILNEKEKKVMQAKVIEKLKDMEAYGVLDEIGICYKEENEDKTVVPFAFEKFENELVACIKQVFQYIKEQYCEEHIYSFSLAITESFDSLYFIANTEEALANGNDEMECKYAEEKWSIWITDFEEIESLSLELRKYLEKIKRKDNRQEFNNHLAEILITTMVKLRKNKYFDKNLLINVYIGEWLSEEESINIYQQLNAGRYVEEYKRFLLGDY